MFVWACCRPRNGNNPFFLMMAVLCGWGDCFFRLLAHAWDASLCRLYKRIAISVQLDLKELRELLAALDQTDISELTLKSGDFELTVRKNNASYEVRPPESVPAVGVNSAEVMPAMPISPPAVISPEPAKGLSPGPSAGPPASDKKLVDVISPMVGTFYRAPAPDEPPFVEVGDRISTGSTVCIIEAMKLMNEIEAEVSGTVVEILGKNGAPVEYGQVLMRIKVD